MCPTLNTPTPTHQLVDLRSLSFDELGIFVKTLGLPSFRAKQIFSWLYRPQVRSFDQMTDISLEWRDKLSELACISELNCVKKERSADGTVKYAFELEDGEWIESVLIPDEKRYTLCVSSQVGCAMGCRFCLTATMGFRRNLTPAEIVNQVVAAKNDLAEEENSRLNNLVFMGMGEPLANFDNVLKAINILLDPRGLDFADRKITVSTCGLVPKIAQLGEHARVNLAISLHAPTDSIRGTLMPVNATYPLADLLEACRRFPMPKRKRIMFEYTLFDGINDRPEDARQLARLLRGIPCKINLLPFNECADLPFKRSTDEKILEFQEILRKANYTVLLRESRGGDISAACGQLAAKER